MAGFFDKIIHSDVSEDFSPTPESGYDDAAGAALPDSASDYSRENALDNETRTLKQVRDAVQELLKYGLLETSQKPNLYRIALTNTDEIARILEPLDLRMGIDDIRGLLYATVRQDDLPDQDEWSHPLVRRQRLNLEQSLLVAILRQAFIAYEQESGTGANQALIAIDDLIPQLQVYLGDPGSESKERTRVINLLDQLKGHGLVSALDEHERVIIRPIIAHLADPVNLQALLVWLREQVEDKRLPDRDSDFTDQEDPA